LPTFASQQTTCFFLFVSVCMCVSQLYVGYSVR
jgi:hypothetical protein